MKTKKIIGFLILSGLLIVSGRADATNSFGQSADIFQIGAGARAMGMGGAFTGLADDASAPYYNPSGLAYLDEHQIMAMHAPLMLDSNYNYLATAHPFGDKWGTLALSDVLLLSKKFELRDQYNNVTGTDGDVRHNVIMGSYARKLPMNFAAGANVKIIQQQVVGFSGSALGLDLGFMYRPSSLLSVGYAMQNVNSPEVTLDSKGDPYRPLNRLGVASEVFKGKVNLTADMLKISKEKALYAAGVEFSPNELFQLRAGYNANRSYTFGLGIKIHPFRVDYAFSDTDLGAFNKVSFTWAWHNIYKTEIDPPVKEGRAVYPLSGFENQVAFKPSVPNQAVSRWSLVIRNQEGQEVRTIEADLKPPEIIAWDAKNTLGEPVVAGKYTYTFDVKYRNGKEWTVKGGIDLALPTNKMEEVVDMDLNINGARATEEEGR